MARGCYTARASNDHSTQAGRRLAVRAAFALHLYTQPRTPFCRCPRSIEDGEITKPRRTPSSGGTHRYGWQKSESFEPYEPGPRSGPSSRPLPSRCARHPPPGRGWAGNMEEKNVASNPAYPILWGGKGDHALQTCLPPLVGGRGTTKWWKGAAEGGQDRDGASYRCSVPYTLSRFAGLPLKGKRENMWHWILCHI